MDILTARNKEGGAYYPICIDGPCDGEGCIRENCNFDSRICEKLAAYEDTGLTPEEIHQMQIEWVVMKAAKLSDKEQAEKPEIYGDGYDDDGNLIYDTWDCPRCGVSYEVDYDDYDYCPNCGQKIDWSDEDE